MEQIKKGTVKESFYLLLLSCTFSYIELRPGEMGYLCSSPTNQTLTRTCVDFPVALTNLVMSTVPLYTLFPNFIL